MRVERKGCLLRFQYLGVGGCHDICVEQLPMTCSRLPSPFFHCLPDCLAAQVEVLSRELQRISADNNDLHQQVHP